MQGGIGEGQVGAEDPCRHLNMMRSRIRGNGGSRRVLRLEELPPFNCKPAA